MKKKWTLILALLILLAIPMAASAHGNGHQQGPQHGKGYNQGHNQHHKQKVVYHDKHRKAHHGPQHTRYVVKYKEARPHYVYNPAVIVGFPHVVVHFDW